MPKLQQDFFAITGKDTQSITFNDFRAIDGTNGTSGEKFFTAEASSKVFSQAKRYCRGRQKFFTVILKL